MNKPKFLDYDEWLKFHQFHEDDYMETCERCDGTGNKECSCDVCGDDHATDCPACDGDGEISTLPTIYEKEKRVDRKRWNRYNKQFA